MNLSLLIMCMFLAEPTDRFERPFRTKSLYIARLVVKKGGNIHSRVNFKNKRQLLEKWTDGKRVWINPDATAIIDAHTVEMSTKLLLTAEDIRYLSIDDRMPN